jgi:cytochrome b-561
MTESTPSQPAPAGVLRRSTGWVDERLNLGALYRKYGRKVFPVHSTFFFGEMALFAFVILVLTGTYLAFIYVPSNAEVTVDGETVPEAYASVRLIESIPVANLFRNTHHWAAHLMVASIILHVLRIFLHGSYRKPREINWIIGVGLLLLTLGAGFYGYALPFDSYAVTATGIGYSIARSIPWVGHIVADFAFGGAFPTLGSLARIYTIHIFVIPLSIIFLIGAHLLVVVKQKHTQPGYARRLSEPGKVLGVPLIPYQALLAGQLLLLMFGVLFLLSAFVPAHPLDAYGPPTPETPEVKPDWYLMWIYGFLKIIPPEVSFTLFGATFGPTFFGGVVFPLAFFALILAAPFLDRTNRRVIGTYEYLEPPVQAPVRQTMTVAILAFLGTLFIAAYYDDLRLTLRQIWAIVVFVPVVAGSATLLISRRSMPTVRFDPRSSSVPVHAEEPETAREAEVVPVPPTPVPAPMPPQPPAAEPWIGQRYGPGYLTRFPTIAARGERARDSVVAALHEMGELAPLVRQTEDPEELAEVLEYLESLRFGLADSNQTLLGVVRGEEDSA